MVAKKPQRTRSRVASPTEPFPDVHELSLSLGGELMGIFHERLLTPRYKSLGENGPHRVASLAYVSGLLMSFAASEYAGNRNELTDEMKDGLESFFQHFAGLGARDGLVANIANSRLSRQDARRAQRAASVFGEAFRASIQSILAEPTPAPRRRRAPGGVAP